jgi:deoxyribonuclease-4
VRPRIGAHVSTAGGVHLAPERALAIGAEAMQIWVDQPLRFPVAPLDDTKLRLLRMELVRTGLPAVVHVPYLVNLASALPAHLERSIEMVARALRASRISGLDGAVVHLGSHQGRGYEAVRLQVLDALLESARRARVRDKLLIENAAGAGGQLGADLGELRDVLDALAARGIRARVCLDTAHAHVNGADLSGAAGAAAFAQRLREAELAERIAVVHANDAATERGSRHDVHANPGEGRIGARGFRALATVPELARVPWILEVPGPERSGPTAREVGRLKRILAFKPARAR